MHLRLALPADWAALHRIRTAVTENRLSDPSRVTEADYVEHLATLGRGWVAQEGDALLGFAIGRTTDGNIWALFVDPEHEGRGVGRALHDAMVDWLFAQGLSRLWLTTGRGTRAEGFYLQRGWRADDSCLGDEVRMTLEARSRGDGKRSVGGA